MKESTRRTREREGKVHEGEAGGPIVVKIATQLVKSFDFTVCKNIPC